MKFNEEILCKILQTRAYFDIYNFLIDKASYKEVIIQRIKNFSL